MKNLHNYNLLDSTDTSMNKFFQKHIRTCTQTHQFNSLMAVMHVNLH